MSASPVNKSAREVGASYFALRHQRCAPEDARKAVEIENAKRQMLRDFRDILSKGTEKERAEAIEEVAELVKEGEFRPFIELAVPLSFCINPTASYGEKGAVAALIAAVASAPEEKMEASGFGDGVRRHLMNLAVKFQDFLFRNDFFKEAKTGLFEQATRELIKINPERALKIILNGLNALNCECRQYLSSKALVEGLEGTEMRSRAELLDLADKMAKVSDSPVFMEAVKRAGEAFKKDVERRLETAKEIAKENPMVRIVQIACMIKLVGEAQAALGTMDILEAREIRDALANARALMKGLGS